MTSSDESGTDAVEYGGEEHLQSIAHVEPLDNGLHVGKPESVDENRRSTTASEPGTVDWYALTYAPRRLM